MMRAVETRPSRIPLVPQKLLSPASEVFLKPRWMDSHGPNTLRVGSR
jgi:hypothetical protein